MRDYLGNKMHAPHARMSKPSPDDDSERNAASELAYLHQSSKLTIARSEALDPQYKEKQKDYNERSVKNIPHLSNTGSEYAFIVCGRKITNVSEVYCVK
jgi:hypothetical protein